MKVNFVEITKKEYLCIVINGQWQDIGRFTSKNQLGVVVELIHNSFNTKRGLLIYNIISMHDIPNKTINAIEDFIFETRG